MVAAFLTAQTFKEIIPNAKAGNYTFFGTLNVSSGVNSKYCGIALPPSGGGPLYISPQYPTNGNNVNTFTVTESDLDRPIAFSTSHTTQGQSYNWSNIMIIEGNQTSNTPAYMPYFTGLKNAFFKEIVSTGKNLISFPYSYDSRTINGVAFIVNDDGSVTANGTATANIDYFIRSRSDLISLFVGKSYTCSGCPSGGSPSTYAIIIQDNEAIYNAHYDFGSGVTFSSVLSDYYIVLRIYQGYTANNLVFKPMLNEGSSALPYEQYTSNELSLPAPIELAEWDTLDFVNGNKNVQSHTETFDGTENWGLSSNDNYYIFGVVLPVIGANMGTPAGFICNFLPVKYPMAGSVGTYMAGTKLRETIQVYFLKTEYPDMNTVSAFKAQLAAWNAAGNPLTVCYKTATATTTPMNATENRYTAYKGGSETVIQGTTDNSKYGAENTLTQEYYNLEVNDDE